MYWLLHGNTWHRARGGEVQHNAEQRTNSMHAGLYISKCTKNTEKWHYEAMT